MKKIIASFAMLLFLNATAFPQEIKPQVPETKRVEKTVDKTVSVSPDIKIPQTLAIKPGRALKIKVETSCEIVKWVLLDTTDADLLPSDGTKDAIFATPTKGTYRVLVYTASGNAPSDPAVCLINVTDNPDNDNPPNPPGPGPVDPFVKALQEAYNKDPNKNKEDLALLASIYKNSDTIVKDEKLSTAKDVLNSMHLAASTVIQDKMQPLRAAIQKELDSKLPTANVKLDAEKRNAISAQFKKVYDSLNKVQ